MGWAWDVSEPCGSRVLTAPWGGTGIPTFNFGHISIGTAGRNVNAFVELGARLDRGVPVQELPLVLVIEDDPDIQVIVEDALTEGGFEPAIAASGEEGVTLLKSGLIKYRVAGDRRDLEGQDGRLGGCSPIQRDRSRLSYRLHHRGGGPALALARCAQQHSLGKTVRASAACRCGLPSSQYWKRVATSALIVRRAGLLQFLAFPCGSGLRQASGPDRQPSKAQIWSIKS